KCRKRFEPGRRANQFRHGGGSHHDGRLYCSRSCQQKAYRQRRAGASATVTPNRNCAPAIVSKGPATTDLHATITPAHQRIENVEVFLTKIDKARPLFRTAAGELAVDNEWPGMYRVKWRDGSLSDMVNYTRASQALRDVLV